MTDPFDELVPEVIEVSPAVYDELVEMLERPAEPIPELVELFRRTRRFTFPMVKRHRLVLPDPNWLHGPRSDIPPQSET